MNKIQITLSVEESKELIALGILEHQDVKKALNSNKILLKGGTTVSRISEKLIGIPLRICGRITERGCASAEISSDLPHSVIIKNYNYTNIDKTFEESIASLECDDLIICSANAIDSFGNAALMAGSAGGGDVGMSLGGWFTEGAKIIIPAGIEKMVPGNLTEIVKNAGRKNKYFSYGMSVGLFPLYGEIITEIEALKLISNDISVYPLGSGGLYKANGSVTLEIQGSKESLDAIIRIVKKIKSSGKAVSGTVESLKECGFPNERCGTHLGCSYKSGEIKEKRKTKIGFITIGQSPRIDITKDIFPLLSDKFKITEAGALDDFTPEEINNDFAPGEGDEVLVTKMRNGSQAVIAEKYILELLQNAISKLEEENNEIIVMLCTGRFPEFKHSSILLTPQKMLQDIAKSFSSGKKIGLIIPDESQKKQIKHWWGDIDLEVTAASPYLDINNLKTAAEYLKSKNVDIIFMDCMGYTSSMKDMVKEITGKKVFLPRTIIARVLNELE